MRVVAYLLLGLGSVALALTALTLALMLVRAAWSLVQKARKTL